MRVLFVCLGNICRSPLAEAIFNKQIADAGHSDTVTADSCGTAAYHIGEPPDPRTIEISEANGVPINHRGRQLTTKDFDDFDHILVMDENNFHDALAVAPDIAADKVKLLRDYDPNPDDGQVPDPYWGGADGFRDVFDILDRSISNFIDQNVDG